MSEGEGGTHSNPLWLPPWWLLSLLWEDSTLRGLDRPLWEGRGWKWEPALPAGQCAWVEEPPFIPLYHPPTPSLFLIRPISYFFSQPFLLLPGFVWLIGWTVQCWGSFMYGLVPYCCVATDQLSISLEQACIMYPSCPSLSVFLLQSP